MPAVYPGRWTRGTILNQALQRVGNRKILHLARDRLNRLLEEIYTQWEWPFLYKESAFTFPAGNTGGNLSLYASVVLPTDFLKTRDEVTGLRVIALDGEVVDFPVVEMDPIQFARKAVPHDEEGDRPRLFSVDYSSLFAVFWPKPTRTCSALLTYKFLPPDKDIGSGSNQLTSDYDGDTPLFPWGSFLADAMEVWALEYEGDGRASQRKGEVWGENGAFDRIRSIAMPRDSQESTIRLDPTIFGPGFRDESSESDWEW